MREASRNCVWDKSWVQQIMNRFESQLQACRFKDQHPNHCSGSCLSIALFALPSHRLCKINCNAVCIVGFHTVTNMLNNATRNSSLQLCVHCHVFKTACLLARLFSSTELAFLAKLQANQSFPPETEIPGCVS